MKLKEQLKELARSYNDGELTAYEFRQRMVILMIDFDIPLEAPMESNINWLASALAQAV